VSALAGGGREYGIIFTRSLCMWRERLRSQVLS